MVENYSPPSFHTLADEFLRRLRTDSSYTVQQFAGEHPHLRKEILDEIPGLILAESLAGDEDGIELPKTVGRYTVGQEIGRGAMGIVVSATNPDLESEVAIKLLPFERQHSLDMLKRFHVEAKICAAMDHPNIVSVFDYGTDDNFAFLVMRKIKGKSLDKVIAGLRKCSGPTPAGGIVLDWNFVSSIGVQAADALHYAHEQGVIHRDIKPANLILEEQGRLWVSDFGLSKVLGSEVQLSMTGDVLGTPRYMAPEQLRGVYNARSDVYSLGMTLYELVSVDPIWDPSMSTSQFMATKQTHSLPHLKTLNPAAPDALCEVIMQAVELNPDDRFATAQDLCTALKQANEGTFIGDRRSRDRAVSRRNLIRNLAFAGCAAVLTSTCVYLLMPSMDEELAKALQQPENVREFLSQEESREVLIDQIPNLFQTAFETEDKELRTLFADLATEFLAPAIEDFDQITDEQKADNIGKLQRIRDSYIENGVVDAEMAEVIETERKQRALAGLTFRNRVLGIRAEIEAVDLPAPWKENAQTQITRFLDAEESNLLSPMQLLRIKNMLMFLVNVDGPNNTALSAESLQYFVSFLEKEIDRIGQLGSAFPVIPNQIELPSAGSEPNSQQATQQLGKLLEKLERDPQVSELLDKVIKDPRLSDLMERTKELSGK